MKILISEANLSNIAIVMKFVILPDTPQLLQFALNVMKSNWLSSDKTSQSQVSCKISLWYINDYGSSETNVAVFNYPLKIYYNWS